MGCGSSSKIISEPDYKEPKMKNQQHQIADVKDFNLAAGMLVQ